MDSGEDGGIDGGEDCYWGNYTINDHADMVFFKPYTCITGNLAINLHDDLSIELPDLISIEMGFYIHGNSDNFLNLKSLEFIGGGLWIFDNPFLSDCGVCELLDQLVSMPPTIKVYGNLEDDCTPVPEGC